MVTRRAAAIVAAAAIVVVAAATRGRAAGGTGTGTGARAAGPLERAALAVVATAHDPEARTSAVRVVELGGGAERALGAVPHARGAVVRGDVVRGGALAGRAVVVAADDEGAPDPDWGATLWLLLDDAHVAAPSPLARGLLHASRPLASRDGLVYVERGARGEQRPGVVRVDALEIDALDPTRPSAPLHALYTWNGWALHLAGERGDELLVYRVGPGTADVVAIARATGKARVVSRVPPYARDFSVDERRGALVTSNRDEAARAWVVERVDLTTGERTHLASSRAESPAPFALPSGDLAFSAPSSHGGLALAPLATGGDPRELRPLGPGFDAVEAATDDGAWLAVSHVTPGAFDRTVALHVATRTVVPLTSRDERVDALGFLGAASGVAR